MRSNNALHKRINGFQVFESSKVTIRAPQCGHAVFNANGCYACIVKLPAPEFGFSREIRQDAPVLRAAVQDMRMRRGEPYVDLEERLLVLAGGIENLWIRYDRQEFMQTTHRDSPSLTTFGQRFQASKSLRVKVRFCPVCVHQNIGINRDHRVGFTAREVTWSSSICCQRRGSEINIFLP